MMRIEHYDAKRRIVTTRDDKVYLRYFTAPFRGLG